MDEQAAGDIPLPIIFNFGRDGNNRVWAWDMFGTGQFKSTGWRTGRDRVTGRYHYYNVRTGVFQLDEPTVTEAEVAPQPFSFFNIFRSRPFVFPKSAPDVLGPLPRPSWLVRKQARRRARKKRLKNGSTARRARQRKNKRNRKKQVQQKRLARFPPPIQAVRIALEEPPKKRGKSDARRAHDELHVFRAVKVKLNSIRGSPRIWPLVKGLLDNVACINSRVAHEAYILAELHIRRLLEEGKQLPDLDQNFFYSICCRVTDSITRIVDKEIQLSADRYHELRPADLDRPPNTYMSHVLNSLAKEMATATRNHICLNFMKFLERYVKISYNVDDDLVTARKFIWNSFSLSLEHLNDDQKELRSWLVLDPRWESVIEKNLGYFVGKMLDMLKHYDTFARDTRGIRRFTLLPKKGAYTPGFFTVDRSTLPDLLKLLPADAQVAIINAMLHRLNGVTRLDKASVLRLRRLLLCRREARTKFDQEYQRDDELADLLWKTLFDVTKFERPLQQNENGEVIKPAIKFAYQIKTDGEAVSVILYKVKPAIPPNDEYDEVDQARLKFANGECDLTIGIDPGRTYAAYAHRGELDEDDNGRERTVCFRVSTKELRHDSKMNEREMWEKRMREANPNYRAAVQALPSLKVGNFSTFVENVHGTLTQSKLLLEHHEKKRKYRAFNFKVSRFTKKALGKAARKLTKKRNPEAGERRDCHSPQRTIIGWGNWSQQDGFLKGTPKAPVKKLRRAFKKMGFTIVEVDEHRTSKCCCRCGSEMQNVSYPNRANCHQVVRCPNTNNECGVVWQRDCNASRNIHAILLTMLQGQPRPAALRRRGAHDVVED